jgi:hypothetical protein
MLAIYIFVDFLKSTKVFKRIKNNQGHRGLTGQSVSDEFGVDREAIDFATQIRQMNQTRTLTATWTIPGTYVDAEKWLKKEVVESVNSNPSKVPVKLRTRFEILKDKDNDKNSDKSKS